ncbi:MAG: hypothetical protein IV089_09560 [Thiobacillus sp.]|nr:hypothetical protein [Thiobacillus sp.]
MNALTLRTMRTFPSGIQHLIRAHADSFGDIDELVQDVAESLLKAKCGDTLRTIFKRGRSANRRFTQDLAHYARSLGAVADLAAADADDQPRRGLKRRDITRDIAETFRVTPQRAGQIVDEQLKRAAQGDLFSDDGSGDDDGKGDK